MAAVLISTKGQIVLPVGVRRALDLKPGMRVELTVEGKKAIIARAPEKETTSLADVRSLLRRASPGALPPPKTAKRVAVADMRVKKTDRYHD